MKIAEERPQTATTSVGAPAVAIQKSRANWRLGKRAAVVGGIIAAIAAGAAIYGLRSPRSEYLTAYADRADMDSTVTTTGNLNAVTTVQVGSQVSGNIQALYADFNTKVKKGQLVALIDPAPFQAALDQAKGALGSARAAKKTAEASLAKSQADLASAQANVASQKANLVKARSAVDLAKTEADRRAVLIRQNATSQEDYDTAKANYDQAAAAVDAANAALTAAGAAADSAGKSVEVARAELEQAAATVEEDTAELKQAQLNLDHTHILAPVDGTVESRNMDVGQTVAASFQAPVIFLIAQDLTKMQVDTNVGEADVAAIRLDQQAAFTVDAYPGETFTGKVSQVRQSPINVQNVITYDVVIAVSNADLKLFPGMTANVTISTAHVSKALRIPKAALRFRPRLANTKSVRTSGGPQSQIIYTLDNRRQLKPIPVRLGIGDATYLQVLEGPLRAGDEVVVGATGASAGATQPPGNSTNGKRLGF